MKIKSINRIEHFFGKVYNLSVKDNHNYVLENGIVVSNCNYCYISAMSNGKNFENICEKAESYWGKLKLEERPLQIAIGS